MFANVISYGLFIAKSIAVAHGGKVWAESKGRGEGSTFFVELPLNLPIPNSGPNKTETAVINPVETKKEIPNNQQTPLSLPSPSNPLTPPLPPAIQTGSADTVKTL